MPVIIARNASTPWDRRGGFYVSERVFMVMIHDLKQRDRGGGQSFEVSPEVPWQSTRELFNHCYGVGDADGRGSVFVAYGTIEQFYTRSGKSVRICCSLKHKCISLPPIAIFNVFCVLKYKPLLYKGRW